MRMEHTGTGGIIGAPLPAMSCIHVADIEAAINHWRARAPSPDGVGLAPEIEAYEDFVKYRASEARRRGMDPAELNRSDFLKAREQALLARMRRRRRGGNSGGRRRSPFSLF